MRRANGRHPGRPGPKWASLSSQAAASDADAPRLTRDARASSLSASKISRERWRRQESNPRRNPLEERLTVAARSSGVSAGRRRDRPREERRVLPGTTGKPEEEDLRRRAERRRQRIGTPLQRKRAPSSHMRRDHDWPAPTRNSGRVRLDACDHAQLLASRKRKICALVSLTMWSGAFVRR
jgi:hypothetical protein